MSVIKITVNDQNLLITDAPKIAAQGVNENYIEFTFSEDWDGFGKTANFYRDTAPTVIYQSVVDQNGYAAIPHEITANESWICIGLSGVKDDVVKTSEILKYKIVNGLYVVESTDPTPDVYEQILALAGNIEDLITQIGTDTAASIAAIEESTASSIANIQETVDGIDAAVDQVDARMDTFIASQTGTSNGTLITETSLFTASSPAKTDITVSDDINNYNYIDIRYAVFGRTKISRFLPSDIETGAHWSEFEHVNTIDIDTGATDPNARSVLRKVGFKLTRASATSLSCELEVWRWDGKSTTNGVNAETISSSWNVGIYSITGVKYEAAGTSKDAELTDIRVGADGVTYATAGEAVRTQFTNADNEVQSLKEDLNIVPQPYKMANYEDLLALFSITKGKAVDSSGSNTARSYACRTSLINISSRNVFINVSSDYQYDIHTFTQDSSVSGGTLLKQNVKGGNPTFVIFPDTAKTFAVSFYTIDRDTSHTMTDTDVTAIHDSLCVSLEKLGKRTYIVSAQFEHQTMSSQGSNNDKGIGITNFYKRYRQQKYLKVVPLDFVAVTGATGETATLFEYDADMAFVKMTSSVTSETFIRVSGNTHYVKFVMVFDTAETHTMYVHRTITVRSNRKPGMIFNQKKAESQRCVFAVPYPLPLSVTDTDADDYTPTVHDVGYSAGIIMLPDTYTVDGDPTPLIIFCHSSGYYYNFDQYEFDLHMAMYRYLTAEGYAVFDTFGHSSFATPNASKPRVYGNPDNMACYSAGYKWVLDNFNVRRDGVYVSGKSLGGSPALNIVFGRCRIPVKACGLMAPGTNFVRKAFGYNEADRLENAWAFGLTDYTTALSGSGIIASVLARESFQTLMEEQYEKFCDWVPFWANTAGVFNNKDAFLDSAYLGVEGVDVSTGDGDTELWANYSKYCAVPIKLWCAKDDDSVPYRANYNLVHMLQNGGSVAELRTLKSGTGSHHAMDFDEELSEKVGDVVTATGVTVENVPAAYYEMVQFFRRFE